MGEEKLGEHGDVSSLLLDIKLTLGGAGMVGLACL